MPTRAPSRPPIALLSDFGCRDHYAGVMRGVIASLAPAAPVIDITHGVPAQSVIAGALALRESWRYFPPATIFVAVVDPGVGSARRPIAIETRAGARLVGPDNGVLWLTVEQAGLKRAVELRAARYRLAAVSTSFHGRDIFAPAAAHLWLRAALSALGPPAAGLAELSLGEAREGARELRGATVYVDGFGNLVSNIERARVERWRARFPSRNLSVKVAGSAPVGIRATYGDAAEGAPVAIFGSFELLEVAVRDGSAARQFAAGPGTPITVQAGG